MPPYLELALRRGAALASFDGPLRRVARKLGVPLLPPKIADEDGLTADRWPCRARGNECSCPPDA